MIVEPVVIVLAVDPRPYVIIPSTKIHAFDCGCLRTNKIGKGITVSVIGIFDYDIVWHAIEDGHNVKFTVSGVGNGHCSTKAFLGEPGS